MARRWPKSVGQWSWGHLASWLGLAAELRTRGWAVVATARDTASAARLEALAVRPGSGLVVDITDAPVVDALRRRVDGQVLDLLFVNAGIAGPPHQDAARVASEEITALFLTNAVRPARIFLDLVRDGAGIVAFMTSGLGSVANNTVGGSELYRASKAALNSLARSFAARLGGRQITVLAVAPGWVRADMGGRSAPLSAEASV